MSTRGFLAAVVAMSVLALLFAGCGGGGDSETGATTKAGFVKEADAVCLKNTAKRGQMISELSQQFTGKKPTQAQREELVLKLLPTYEDTAAQLGELAPPAGDEEKIEAIVEAMEEAAERVKANPSAALVGSIPFDKANKLVAAYGLEKCSV